MKPIFSLDFQKPRQLAIKRKEKFKLLFRMLNNDSLFSGQTNFHYLSEKSNRYFLPKIGGYFFPRLRQHTSAIWCFTRKLVTNALKHMRRVTDVKITSEF